VRAFPNPVNLQTDGTIAFETVPDATIRLYSVAGELRGILKADGSGRAQWPLRGDTGTTAVSGVFAAVATSGNRRGVLRFAVAR
jgi:hypothetical protein